MDILVEISENLQKGKAKIVKELVGQAVEQGIPAKEVLEKGLLAGMDVVGEKFKNNEVFVPEVLVAARAMNQGAELLKPLLTDKEIFGVDLFEAGLAGLVCRYFEEMVKGPGAVRSALESCICLQAAPDRQI